MALSRTTKESLLEQYEGGLAASANAFLVAFEGITVEEVNELRRRVRESGGSYSVVKNRLVRRAIEGKQMDGLSDQFSGPTAVAYSDTDAVLLAKALVDFAKEVPVVKFKAGLVDGQLVDSEEIEAIASLPSRDELIARLLYMLQSPISRLVRGLGAIPQQFGSVLEQVRLQKDGA